jgi:hypothetical protein
MLRSYLYEASNVLLTRISQSGRVVMHRAKPRRPVNLKPFGMAFHRIGLSTNSAAKFICAVTTIPCAKSPSMI